MAARSRFKSRLVSTTAMAGLAGVLLTAMPLDPALAAGGLLLFAPNLNDDTVSVLTTNADGSLTAGPTIGAGVAPFYVAVRGDQAYAYVSNSTSDTVSVIDTSTNMVIQTIATGTNAGGIALTPDGSQLYVANQDVQTVSAYTVDTTTGLLTANGTINTGMVPHDPAVSPDGTRLYIPNFSSNTVTVVNTAGNTFVTTVNVGTAPISVTVSPDGTRAYVANITGNNISIIDTATNMVTGTASSGNGPRSVAVRPDGKFYYSADSVSGTITAYDAATDLSIGTVASSDLVYLAMSPDGTALYASNKGTSDTVTHYSIDPVTGLLTDQGSLSVGNDPWGLAMCGNGDALLKSGSTFVANTAGALGCTGTSADFTGGTLKVNGTGLDFSTGMTLGSGGGTINTNGNDTTVSSGISGTGALVKSGSGTLTLTGANSYTGGTTISTGTLVGDTSSLTGNITDNAALTFSQAADGAFAGDIGGTGSLTKTGAGTLTLTGTNSYTGGTTISAGTLVGDTDSLTGNITNNAALAFSQAADGTFSGDISGTGSFAKTGAGVLTLSGNNSYTGTTTLSSGTLKAGAAQVLGTNSAVSLAAATTLDLNGFDQTVGSLSGTGNVSLGTAALSVGGDNSSTAYGGSMSGSGSLTKTGSGTLTLTGSNSYTGGTTIAGGTLVGNSDSLTGNIANNAALTFNQTAAGTYTGNITGTGSLTKTGSGTLTLTGANSYAGGTTVSGGTLAGNTASLTGDITNNAALAFNQTADGTYAGNIGGTGSFTKTSSGTLTLSGSNSYTGGTTVSAGELAGDTTSLTGDITDHAKLTFNQTWDDSFSGAISGTGSLTKTGSGTLTLSGSNSYTGGTTISGGALVGNTTSLSGDITDNAALTFNQTADGVFAGNISGSGSFTKAGAGTLTLSGTNSYTGGTLVSNGKLIGNSASLTGAITNNAALVFDQATDGAFSGSISGTGTVTKSGGGRLDLAAGSSISAASLVVEAGHLAINGDASGTQVMVAEGASLGGNGHFGGLTLGPGATVAPGNSIGTLNVGGDITFAPDTIYAVEVDAAGNGDTIIAAGTASLDGFVQVIAADGDYAPETSYTILTANAVTGNFTSVSSNFAFLVPTLNYGDSTVTLTLERNNVAFADAAETANQKAAGGAAEQAFVYGDPLYKVLVSASLDEARAAFDLMSGEVHAAVIGNMVEETSNVRRTVLSRDDRPAESDRTQLWIQFLGDWSSRKATANEAAVDGFSKGFLAGADHRLGDHAGIGVVAGYTTASADLAARTSRAQFSAAHVGVHALLTFAATTVRAGVIRSFQDVDTRRTVSFGGFGEQLRATYGAAVTQGFGELSQRMVLPHGMLEIYGGAATAWVRKDAFSEDGGATALTDSGQRQNFSWSTLGLRGAGTLGEDQALSLRGGVAWQHALDAVAVSTSLAFAGSDSFVVTGAPLSEDSVLVDAGFGWQVGPGVDLNVAYSGEVGESRTSHAVKVGLSAGF